MAAKDTDEPKTEEQDADITLDLSQTAIKRLFAEARERGYITYAQINAALPSDQVSSEQIEDIMAMLSEMGINVIDEEETEEAAPESAGELVEASGSREVALAATPTETLDRTDDRCGCTCARWVRSSCCRARARSPSPSASRPAATR